MPSSRKCIIPGCNNLQNSFYAAAPGEQLGVRCLAQGSHLSRGIEGTESAGYSLPHLQFLPDLRLEPATPFFARSVRLTTLHCWYVLGFYFVGSYPVTETVECAF